ncbi:UDP-N-acetylglucosamine 1-carboxyvinyltransferase [Patescibacteria group bacterium]|nr:UDP-N-acetylglucosamine 1-carboxyvinyltransferase [Patescibacteria group bacterium]MBU1867944.1 UDP-N-acetylglucosamine 1-carboxyvinyltransferase [Patescibacteria group bacterium]
MKYIIEGGIRLKGEYSVSGAKNAALKMLMATLLTPEAVILKNVPRISETDVILEILQFLGAKVKWRNDHEVLVHAQNITGAAIPIELAKKCRTSFLTLGALLGRLGKASIPDPGGCQIGRRPVDRHIEAFRQLGIEITRENGFFHAHGKPTGGVIEFPKNTHTGTENAIIASVLAKGEVLIKNAAQEPEVDNLIVMLNSMGAKIKRVDPREIQIKGVDQLKGTQCRVIGDRIEAVTAATAAAITRGDILIKGITSEYLTSALSKFEEIGVNFKATEEGLHVWSHTNDPLYPVSIESRPYPGFMCDWLPLFTTLLTQADGESTVHETIHPNRFQYVKHLQSMGAEIQLFNPAVPNPEEFYNFNSEDNDPKYNHAAKIFGPTPLVSTKLEASDIRAGATLVIAALASKGTCELKGIEHIHRGYENFSEKLRALGAKISLENETNDETGNQPRPGHTC